MFNVYPFNSTTFNGLLITSSDKGGEIPRLVIIRDVVRFADDKPVLAVVQDKRRNNTFSHAQSSTLVDDTSALVDDMTALVGGQLSPEGGMALMMVDEKIFGINNSSEKPQGLR